LLSSRTAANSRAENASQVGLRFLPEVLVVGLGYFIYSQVRGLAADRTADALQTALWIIDLERHLGFFKELALQQRVLAVRGLIEPFNFIYFYGLFPLIIPTAIWLFLRHRPTYVVMRNAFLISGGIAVVFYLLTPCMPPRLLPGFNFVDTALGRSWVPSYSSIPGVNHYAALPSMHVGWNLLVAIGLAGTVDARWLRRAVLVIPLLMLVSTVVTGNHYFFDGIAGMSIASAGLAVALLIEKKFASNPGASLPNLRSSAQPT
jgi:membrane-associated phospholipid phosphatase